MSNANQAIDVGHDIRAAIRKHWVSAARRASTPRTQPRFGSAT